MTFLTSIASCTWDRCRAGSVPSSYTSSFTGWPPSPPRALVCFTQTCTPSTTGAMTEPTGPLSDPMLAKTAGEAVEALPPGDTSPPGAGLGAPPRGSGSLGPVWFGDAEAAGVAAGDEGPLT